MAINVIGTKCKVWSQSHDRKDGSKWYTYTVGVSSKNMDGSWSNGYQRVKFSKHSGAPDPIPSGADIEFEGFMTLEVYKNKDGKDIKEPVIMITKAEFPNLGTPGEDDLDTFEQMEEDIPF